MARSGLAAAETLAGLGAQVALYDSQPAECVAEQLAWAGDRGMEAYCDANLVGDCDIVVTSPGVRRTAPILTDALQRGIPIWSEIEAAYRVSCAPILAITGTNGKTTTTALLGEMVRASGRKTFVAGNIAADDLSMPLIRAARDSAADDVIVAEISSFQLEWTPSFRPAVSAILNITADHLDRQTWAEYVAAKWKIAANQHETDTLVLLRDVPLPAGAEVAPSRARPVYFNEVPRPDWIDRLRIPGEHNQENALAAAAMARAFGIDEAAIEKAATEFRGVVHRLEHVATIGGVDYVNNSMCTNNAAFARSLDALSATKVVLAGGEYKGGDMTEMAAAAARPDIRRLVLFGKSAGDIDRQARARGMDRIDVVATMSEAVATARRCAEPGDVVVLNPGCASFDQFKDFEDRGRQFKEMVLACTQSEGSSASD